MYRGWSRDPGYKAALPRALQSISIADIIAVSVPSSQSGLNVTDFVQSRPVSQLLGGKLTFTKRLVVQRVVVRVACLPTWRQPKGKSSVNPPQMLPLRGSICIGVDTRNYRLAPGLPPGRRGARCRWPGSLGIQPRVKPLRSSNTGLYPDSGHPTRGRIPRGRDRCRANSAHT